MNFPAVSYTLLLLFIAKTYDKQFVAAAECDPNCQDTLGNSYCSESGSCQAACPVYIEDEPSVVILRGVNAITIIDEDENDLFMMQSAVVELFPKNSSDFAQVTLNATYQPHGITIDYDRMEGALYIDGDGSVSMYQAIFNSVSIVINNTEPDTVDRVLCFTVFDGNQPSDASCMVLRVVPRNDNPPSLQQFAPSSDLTYVEDGPGILLLSSLSITDEDHAHVFPMQMAQINVSGWCDSTDRITVDTAGTEIVQINEGACITLEGNDTVENYSKVLLTARYSNIGDEPVIEDRTIILTVSDGVNTADPISVTVSLIPVNDHKTEVLIDPQHIEALETAVSKNIRLGQLAMLELRDGDTNDADYVNEMIVEIVNAEDYEQLFIQNEGLSNISIPWTVQGNASARIVLMADYVPNYENLIDFQNLLNTVNYGFKDPNNEPPCPNMRNINITIIDKDMQTSVNYLIVIIDPVNDNPPSIMVPKSVIFHENTPAHPLNGTTITDNDHNQMCKYNTLTMATVTLLDADKYFETFKIDEHFSWLTESPSLCDNEHLLPPTPSMEELYSNMANLSYSYCQVNNDSEIIIVGEATIEQYMMVLESIEYFNNMTEPLEVDRSIQVYINDSVMTSVNMTTLAIRQVNDNPPIIDTDGTTFTFIEESPHPSLLVGPSATILDHDGIEEHRVITMFCVTIEDPTQYDELVLTDNGGNIIEMSGDNDLYDSHHVCMDMDTCKNDFNNVSCFRTQLASVRYQSTDEEPDSVDRTVTITFTASDGYRVSTTSVYVTILVNNDWPPMLFLNGNTTNYYTDYYEGGGPLAISDALTITDNDLVGLVLESAIVTITNAGNGDVLILNETLVQSLCVSIDNSSSTLTTISLHGIASQSNYTNILASIQYMNMADEPAPVDSTVERAIEFTIYDEKKVNSSATAFVTIHPVNDPPQLPHVTVIYDESTKEPVYLYNSTILIDDSDNTTIEWIRIELLPQLDFLDNLTISSSMVPDSIAIVLPEDEGASPPLVSCYPTLSNSTTQAITFMGPASLKDFESAIQSVSFDNICPGLSPVDRSVRVTLYDGVDQYTSWVSIEIDTVDDQPLCYFGYWPGVSKTSYQYFEESPPIPLTSDFTLTDLDGPVSYTGPVTIEMTNVRDEGYERLLFTLSNGVTVTNSTVHNGDGYYNVSYYLENGSSYADYMNVLRTMRYINNHSEPETYLDRYITISINNSYFSPCVVSVEVINTADRPYLFIKPPTHQYPYVEDSGYTSVLMNATFNVTDEDNVFLYLIRYKIIDTPTQYGTINDKLTLIHPEVTLDGNDTNELTVYGPQLYNVHSVLLLIIPLVQFSTDDQATNITRTLSIEVEEYPLGEPGPSKPVLVPIRLVQRNDRPVLTGAPLVSESILETYLPLSVASLKPSHFVDSTVVYDPDSAFPGNPDIIGLAVYEVYNAGIGHWQVLDTSTDKWVSISGISECQPLFMGVNDRIRFAPLTTNDTGPVYFKYTVWDGTSMDDVCSDADTVSVSAETASFTYTLAHAVQKQINATKTEFEYVEESVEYPMIFEGLSLDVSTVTVCTIEIRCTSCTLPITGEYEWVISPLPSQSFSISVTESDDLGVLSFIVYNTNNGSWNVSELQSFLRSLVYNNTALEPEPETRTVTLYLSDGQGTSCRLTVTVNVIQIDDNAPVIHIPAVIEVPEVEAMNGVYIFNDTLITDADIGLDLSFVNIDLEFSSPDCHYTFITVFNESSLTLLTTSVPSEPSFGGLSLIHFTGPGSVDKYNEELSTILYVNIEEEPVHCKDRDLYISVIDGGGNFRDTKPSIRIRTIPSNDQLPDVHVSVATTQHTYTESSPGITPLSGITVTDGDIPSTPLASAEVILTNPLDADNERIYISDPLNEGVNISQNGSHRLIISGPEGVSAETIQENLRRVKYINTNLNPDVSEQRQITVTVTDNLYPGTPTQTDPVSVYVTIDPVNNPPEVILMQDSIMYIGQYSGAVNVAPDADIRDPDNDDIHGLSIQLTGNVTFTELERLSVNEALIPADASIQTTANQEEYLVRVLINGSATIDTYTLILRSLTYQNTNTSTIVFGDRLLTVQPIGNDLEYGLADTIEISYASANPSPVVDLNGKLHAGFDTHHQFIEGSTGILVSEDASIYDKDHTNTTVTIASLRVTLTVYVDITLESLSIEAPSDLTVVWITPNTSLLLQATDNTTMDSFNQAIRSLRYINIADEPSANDTRYISVIANDGVTNSNTAMISIDILNINDPPVLTISGSTVVTYNASSDPVPLLTDPMITDPDSSIFTGIMIVGMTTYPGDVISSSLFIHNDSDIKEFVYDFMLTSTGVIDLLQSLEFSSEADDDELIANDRMYCVSIRDEVDWNHQPGVCVTIRVLLQLRDTYTVQVIEEQANVVVINIGDNDEMMTVDYWNITGGDDCHIDPSMECRFDINDNGDLSTTDTPPDREYKDRYDLTVSATINGYQEITTVTVDVLDINDNAPVILSEPSSPLSINENIPVGTVVATVTITDKDQGVNAVSTISLNDTLGLFNISECGELTVASYIDYETISNPLLTVTVIATNVAPPYLSDILEVTVIVNNANDNPPLVEFATGDVSVLEGTQFSVSLDVGVTITDADGTDDTLIYDAKVQFLNSHPLEPSYPFTPTTANNPSDCLLEDKMDKTLACGLEDPVHIPSDPIQVSASIEDETTMVFTGNGYIREKESIELVNDVSILMWIWYTPSNHSSTILAHVDRASGSISYGAVCHSNGSLEFVYHSQNQQKSEVFGGACASLADAWHHLSIIVHDTQLSIYIDGNYHAGATVTPLQYSSSYRLYIGARPIQGYSPPMTDYFTGRIHRMIISPSVALGPRINCIIGCGVYLYSSILDPPIPYSYNYTLRKLYAHGIRNVTVYEQFLNSLIFVIAFSEPRLLNYDLDYTVADDAFNCIPVQLNITISPSNDGDPVLNLNGPLGQDYTAAVYTEESGPVSIVNASSLTLTDVDLLPYPYEIVATITDSTNDIEILAVSNLPNGMTQTYSDHVLTVQGMFTIDIFQMVLRTLTYDNMADEPTGSNRTVSIIVHDELDGPRYSETTYSTISIVFVNDPPLLHLNATDAVYNEGDQPIVVLKDILIEDSDNLTLVNASITVNALSSSEYITVNATTSITSTYTISNGHDITITLTGEDTIGNYRKVLQSLRYSNTKEDTISGTRQFSFILFDGISLSTVTTVSLSIQSVNNPPVLDINGPEVQGNHINVNFIEDVTQNVSIVGDSLTLIDPDDNVLKAAYLTFTNRPDGPMETVYISPDLGFKLDDSSHSTVVSILPVYGNASVADFIEVLKTLKYVNHAEEPALGDHVIQLTVTDGQHSSEPATITVTIITTNDPPFIDLDANSDGTGFRNIFTEEGPAVNISSDSLIISDNDNPDNVSISDIIITVLNPNDGSMEQIVSDTIEIPTPVMTESMIRYHILNTAGDGESAIDIITSLGYVNNANEPTPGTRLLDIYVLDDVFVSNVARTEIEIELVNDHDPILLPVGTRCIFENQPNMTDVVKVTATDADSGPPGVVRYSLINAYPQNGLSRFDIDEDTGVIYTVVELDREEQQQYVLTVQATDNGDPQRYDRINITVRVVDENDNNVMFSQEVYYAEVSEDAPVGTTVATAMAIDPDHPQQTPIFEPIGHNNYFTIHENGDIVTTSPLDAETTLVHNLTILARESMGNGTDTAVYIITVTNINEHEPVFTESVYQGRVPENLVGGTVTIVTATDADVSGDHLISYKLASASDYDTFTIDTASGRLTTVTELDRELQDTYTLVVLAVDNDGSTPLTGTAIVAVEVLDINDNVPLFDQSNYAINITEGMFKNLRISSATDADLGENSTLAYSVTNKSTPFEVDIIPAGDSVDFGILLTDVRYEVTQTVSALIVATDIGPDPMSSSIPLTINVLDDNNNRPVFINTPYSGQVQENVADYLIVSVNATDKDSGKNGEVRFELLNYQSLFTIDQVSGDIRTAVGLDFEEQCYYELSVTAHDLGQISLTSTVTIVTVTVTGINDVPPVFNQSEYFGSVVESMNGDPFTGGVIAVQVFAMDNESMTCNEQQPVDSPVNITYSLLSHNNDSFTIDPLTGVITTLRNFDREETSQYTLTVSAIDDIGLSNTATVIINIKDINDNEPVFPPDGTYSVVIPMATQVEEPFLRVTAIDLDEGAVTYILTSSQFTIDESTGDISLSSPLTNETDTMFTLYVIAEDPDGKLDATTVTVYVDRSPVIVSVQQILTFTEGQVGLAPFYNLTITDIDTAQTLDSCTVSLHTPLTDINTNSNCYCTNTSDVNTCTSGCYEFIQIPPTSFPGTIVSVNGFTITLNGTYSIDTYVAAINAIRYINIISNPLAIDRNITLSVNDGVSDSNTLTHTIQLLVNNKFSPVLYLNGPGQDNTGYSIQFIEEGPAVTIVTSNNTVVIDQDEDALVTMIEIWLAAPVDGLNEYIMLPDGYVLPDGLALDGSSTQHRLVITGAATNETYVTVLKQVQYMNTALEPDPAQRVINIRLTEHQLVSDTVPVNVEIVLVNDQIPQFTQSVYNANISENTPIGTNVLQVNAFDNDSGHSQFIYNIIGTSSFDINSNGYINTTAAIDYEDATVHVFNITVRNPGSNSLGHATVIVNVLNLYDNAPSLELVPSSATLQEPATQIQLAQALVISVPDLFPFPTLYEAAVSILTGPGTLSVPVPDVGITVTGNNTQSLQFTGTFHILIYQDILRSVLYTDIADEPEVVVRQVSYSLDNGTNLEVFNISVQTINDQSPVILLTSDSHTYYTTYIEDSGPVLISNGTTISDSDSGDGNVIVSAIIELLQAPNGPCESLQVTPPSPSNGLQLNSTGHRVEITGQASSYDYESILNSIRYVNTADNPDTSLTRSISFIVNDGKFNSNTATTHVSIIGVNDPPVMSVGGQDTIVLSYVENRQDPLLLVPQLTITDVDSQSLISASIVLLNADSDEVLNVTSPFNATLIKLNSSALILSAPSGLDTESFEAILRTATYYTQRETSFMSARQVVFIVTDAEGAQSSPLTVTIEFDSTDDNPVLDLNGPSVDGNDYTVEYIEDSNIPTTIISANVSITDIDSQLATNLTITLSTMHDGDTLTFPDHSPLSKYEDGNTIVYSGLQPLSVYIDLLKSFTFINTLEEHLVSDRHIMFQVFTVKAGNGVYSGSNIARTTIRFIPHNEQPPAFTQQVYYGNINENMPAGSEVDVIVVAMDTDIPSDPNITYSIQGGSDYLQVDPYTGEVTTLQPLDAESLHSPYIVAVVTAHDTINTLTATATVNVSVNDVNDNVPMFQLSLYNESVLENATFGAIVVELQATDNDRTLEHSTITYSIRALVIGEGSGVDEGSEDDEPVPFTVNNNGQLLVSGLLNAKEVNSYTFEVSASDGVHQTDTAVLVTVISVNKNSPMFVDEPFSFTVLEDVSPSTSVYSVHAVDNDDNDQVTYSIHGTTVFTIDPHSGTISLVEPLDYETSGPTIVFTVIATDTGSLTDTANVTVVIENINDNPPVFDQDTYTKDIPEALPVGSVVFIAVASDADNDVLTYSITPQSNTFNITSTTGEIRLTTKLDYESTAHYNLTVLAYDGAHTGTTQLQITVTNINDEQPQLNIAQPNVVYTEQSGMTPITSSIQVIDPDNLPLYSATIALHLAECVEYNEDITCSNGRTCHSICGEVISINTSSLADSISISSYTTATTLHINITGQGTVYQYMSLLSSVSYVNMLDEPLPGVRSVSIVVNDGLYEAEANVTVSVEVINDNPVSINTTVSELVFTEGQGSIIVGPLTLSDKDHNPMVQSLVITLTGTLEGQKEFITAEGFGETKTSNGGVIEFTQTGSLDVYQNIVDSLSYTYSTNGNEPLPGTRTVTMTISDGVFNTTIDFSIKVVVLNNNPPVLTFSGPSLVQYQEGSGVINIGSEMLPVVADDDNNDLLFMTNATVRLHHAVDGSYERLNTDNSISNTITVEVSDDGHIVSLQGSASVSLYQQALRAITYTNTAPEPTIMTRLVTYQVYDGQYTSNSLTGSIDIKLINDNNLTLSCGAGGAVFTEESAPVIIAAGLSLDDLDTDHIITSASIELEDPQTGDELSTDGTDGTGLTIDNNGTRIMIQGNSTASMYQGILRSVTFSSSEVEPRSNVRTVLIRVHQLYPSPTYVACAVTVSINLINDNQPSLDLNGADTPDTNWTVILPYTFPDPSRVSLVGNNVLYSDLDQDSVIVEFSVHIAVVGIVGDKLVLDPSVCSNPSAATDCYISITAGSGYTCTCSQTPPAVPTDLHATLISNTLITVNQSGSVSNEDMLMALQQLVMFEHTGLTPLASYESVVSVTVGDGVYKSVPANTTVTVLYENTGPILLINEQDTSGNVSMSDGNTSVYLTPEATVMDDVGNISSVTVSLTNPVHDESISVGDVLNNYNIDLHSSSNSTHLILTGLGTSEQYTTVLRSLLFTYSRMSSLLEQQPDINDRLVTIIATDHEGTAGNLATITIHFDRTCTVWSAHDSTIMIPSDMDVQELGICTSASRFLVYISGNNITTLSPLRDLQSVDTLSLIDVPNLDSLEGLENLGYYAEILIDSVPLLTSMNNLSANLPEDHRISTQNVVIRNNDALKNVNGLRIVKDITYIFNIVGCGSLTDLSGLNSLVSVETFFFIGLPVTDLSGFNRLFNVTDLWIWQNSYIKSITGFPSLRKVESLTIAYSPALENIDGLSGIQQVTQSGSVRLFGNNQTCFIGQNATTEQYWKNLGAESVVLQPSLSICPSSRTCSDNPCLHGAQCISGEGSYTCQCTDMYTGPNCQYIDDCYTLSPCLNGGSCTVNINHDIVQQYQCSCPSGTSGFNCENMD